MPFGDAAGGEDPDVCVVGQSTADHVLAPGYGALASLSSECIGRQMSKESMMKFTDQMLSESAFLRDNCRDLEQYRDPEEPLPISLLGHFGGEIAKRYDTIGLEEWRRLTDLIEQGLASDDTDVGTAVATGLIEVLIHRAEAVDGLWPKIEQGLGSQARSYAAAYRNADFTVNSSPGAE